jgi:hypothetical protein
MLSDIMDDLAVEVDGTPIAQAVEMISSGFHQQRSSGLYSPTEKRVHNTVPLP